MTAKTDGLSRASLMTIPSELVLDLHFSPLRERQQHAVLHAGVRDAPSLRDTQAVVHHASGAMQAAAAGYACFVEALPRLEARLHWLAFALLPQLPDSVVVHVARMKPEARQCLLMALSQAGIDDYALALSRIMPLLPDHATDLAQLSDAQHDRIIEIVAETVDLGLYPTKLRAYLEQDTEARGFIDQTRRAMDDGQRLQALWRVLWPHFREHRDDAAFQLSALQALPQPYRVVWLVETHRFELSSGSFSRVFSNPDAIFAPETADALRLLKLDAHATALERGLALFPTPYPRNPDFTIWPEGLSPALSALGGALDPHEITPALLKYARRKRILPY